MDEYSHKRSPAGFSFSKRGSSLSFREPNNNEKNIQYCNRLGCSTRFNSMRAPQINSPEKSKYPKSSFRSISTKSVGESSSKPLAASTSSRKPHQQCTTTHASPIAPAQTEESSSSKSRKQIAIHDIPSSSSSSSSTSSFIRRPITTKNTGQVTKPSSQYLGSGPPRYGIKNLSCFSSSDHGNGKRVASVRKRPSDGESSSSSSSSSSGGKSLIGSSTNRSLMPQQASRRANQTFTRDGPVSVRTRRSPKQRDDHIVSVPEPIVYPQLSHGQLTIDEVGSESPSSSFAMNPPPIFPSPFSGRPSSGGRNAHSRLISSRLGGSSSRGSLGDRDGYRRFNMEGIAEVLLALERIEPDDEATYEQLMVLETNLFLEGFSFHDQHRDMRLDIDNMSYEELLALEEKMGIVSTALSEEELLKCLEKSRYVPAIQFSETDACEGDDTKCSICQEDYVIGDEVGKLACDHRYHVDCIHQWLQQKNWCPICKKSASPHAEETKD